MDAARSAMRAACLVAPGRMELRSLSAPRLGARDVLVRPTAVGLCGTDFHIFSGEANYHTDALGRPVALESAPQVLGHEIAAVVEEVGADVRDLRAGDRVVVDQGLSCSSRARVPPCEYCATGDSHQCEDYAEHGITGLPGGLAERLAVPAVNAVRIDSDLPDERAALTEPLACVLHTLDVVQRAAARYRLDGRRPTDSVRTVFLAGAGPAGLLFVQVLRNVLGFEGEVLVSEPDAAKRALAAGFGAEVRDPAAVDLAREVAERTGGRKAELLIEASGSGPLWHLVPGLTRKQATLVLYGYGHAGVGLEVLNNVQFREPALVATTGASGGFDADGRPSVYRKALGLLEQGRIDVARLITHRYRGLGAVPSAFQGDHRRAGYVKGLALL
jgi:threonine dehydrogenase-like Zn-dependent dehydrogenase